jgi:hypothetical protein
MKSFYTLITCLLFLAPSYTKASEDSTAVFFSTNSHHLDEVQLHKLIQFVNELDQESDFTVVIRGFTDHRGSPDFNRQLSKRRAESVRQFLQGQGLYPGEIRIEPWGESKAERKGSADEELKSDRRVEVILKNLTFNDLQQLHEALAHGNQTVVKIDPTEPNTIHTARGSRVYIPASALCNHSGEKVCSEVLVEVTEALDPIEFLAENLSTISNGVPLISGGMLKIMAKDEKGNELQLLQGQNITVNIPDQVPDPAMNLFVSNNGSDWQEAKARKPFAYKNLPEKPKCEYPVFRYPAYQPDLKSKPVKPVDPIMPKDLKSPDPEAYKAELKWYDFLWRKSKERKANQAYAVSMDRYMKQARKHDERVEKYKADCRTISQRKLNYASELEKWEAAEFNRRNEWKKSVHDPAYAAWIAEWEKVDSLYLIKYKAWQEKVALLKAEQLSEAEASGQLDINAVSGYSFTTSQLNWINADKFYSQDPEFAKAFEIEGNDPNNEKVVIVFKGMKSVLNTTPDDTRKCYVTPTIATNQNAVILAYKISDDGKIMICVRDLDITKTRQQLEYRETSIRELRKTVDEIVS